MAIENSVARRLNGERLVGPQPHPRENQPINLRIGSLEWCDPAPASVHVSASTARPASSRRNGNSGLDLQLTAFKPRRRSASESTSVMSIRRTN